MNVKRYSDLEVWKKSMDLVANCYRLVRRLPDYEKKFGLSSQIQRAAVSIPANIAEGHERCQTKVFVQFISIAQGSLAELETHLILTERLGYFDNDTLKPFLEQTSEIGKMLNGLRKSLRKKFQTPES